MATRAAVPEAVRAGEAGNRHFIPGMTGQPTWPFTRLEQTVAHSLISNTVNGREKQRVCMLDAIERNKSCIE